MKKILFGVGAVILCVGSFAGGYLANKAPKSATVQTKNNYPLLAQRLFIENPNDVIINFTDLRQEINAYLANNNLSGSVYFEYLPTGTSIRVQGDEELVAASLMKIPVVMELYRAAELGKINLDQTVTLKAEWLDSKFGSLYQKGAGYRLTLREAAKIALEQSDNTAIAAILHSTEKLLDVDENVINSLDIEFSRNEELVLSISARSYSSFLKCLYYSCYLNKADSQEILDHLTRSEFNNRLRAPIPESVVVAHKIGTYSNETQSDCGIIYEPNRNYILCAMLFVPDNETGNGHIAEISEITYNYIKNTETKSTLTVEQTQGCFFAIVIYTTNYETSRSYMKIHKQISVVFIAMLLLGSGFIIGHSNGNKAALSQQAQTSDTHPLLAKRVFLDSPNDILINFTGLRQQLRDYVAANNLRGSVYFEYLPTGTQVRVDDTTEESAASLMKIPVVMELFKASELGRVDLDTKIALKQEWLDDRFGDLYKKGVGYELTLREAAALSLQRSDNTDTAMIIALSREQLQPVENVLTYLDVDFSRPDADTLTISARSYASFLKCLYFSCYVNPQHSEEILQYLTNTSFTNRLRAGVPKDVVMAHKIGTFSNTTMSDCGIVYEPKRNFILCAMLQVPDDEVGNAHITAIAKMAYDFVHDQK